MAANRNWANGGKLYAMHVAAVVVDCTVAIGSTGAVSSVKGPIVSTVTRVSTGIYRLNLQNSFTGTFACVASMQSPSSGLSGIMQIETQNSPNTNVTSTTAPSITVKTLNAAGALADPASGSSLNVLVYLSNSSIQISGE